MDLAASVRLIHQLAFRDHVFILAPAEHDNLAVSVGKSGWKGFFWGDLYAHVYPSLLHDKVSFQDAKCQMLD